MNRFELWDKVARNLQYRWQQPFRSVVALCSRLSLLLLLLLLKSVIINTLHHCMVVAVLLCVLSDGNHLITKQTRQITRVGSVGYTNYPLNKIPAGTARSQQLTLQTHCRCCCCQLLPFCIQGATKMSHKCRYFCDLDKNVCCYIYNTVISKTDVRISRVCSVFFSFK